MKTRSLLIALACVSLAVPAAAQPLPTDLQPIAPSDTAIFGHNFYSIQNISSWPPLPFNWLTETNIQLYASPSLGTNAIFVGDEAVNYAQRAAQSQALRLAKRAAANNAQPAPDSDDGEPGDDPSSGWSGGPWTYGTNEFWLEPISVISNLFNVILHGTTNGSTYLITSTDFLNPQTNGVWFLEGSLQGGTNDATPFALGIATRTNRLFIRAQACDECAATALPLWWQLAYFGVTGVDPSTDYDGDGQILLEEWLYGIDPNKIQFNTIFDNLCVPGSTATATFTVRQGVPAQVAVLCDSTNFALATWTAYSPSVSVDLGSAEGRHDVWIGLKDQAPAAVATWAGFRLTRDTTAPLIFITNPLGTNLARPVLQLHGYSPEPLASVRYDVANAAGTLTNLAGYVTHQWFDTNLVELTTNWFECLDIPLTNGANTITLYATDRAGNSSTSICNYTLDYSTVTNPPAFTLYWPKDGDRVSGTNFTLRGLLDDPTATITAQITDINGTTSQVEGLVERNGLLWVENLPLGPRTNTLTLTMTNVAGLSSSTSLKVIQSDLILTIGTPSTTDLNEPRICVSGTINTDACTAWVNGVAATNVWPNGDGTWSWQAESVPVNEGGVAVVQARAIPNTDNGGQGTGGSGGSMATVENLGNPTSQQSVDAEVQEDKPAKVVIVHYHLERTDYSVRLDVPTLWEDKETESACWEPGYPGDYFHDDCYGETGSKHYLWVQADWDENGFGMESSSPAGGPACGDRGVPWFEGPRQAPTDWPSEYCDVSAARRETEPQAMGVYDHTRTRNALTRYELHTGGKANSGRKNLFVGTCTAFGVGNPFWPSSSGLSGVDYSPHFYGIDPTSIVLGDLGSLGSDGRVYKALADNTTLDITPTVQGNPYYVFAEPGATKHRLRVLANSVPCQPETSPITPEFIVGQFVTFSSDWDGTGNYCGSPPGLLSTTNLWTLTGHYYNDETNSVPSVSWPTCSKDYFVNQAMLTNDPTAAPAWWVSGGIDSPHSYPVKLDEGLFFSNGQYVSLHEEGKIKMWKPRAKISTQTSSVNVLDVTIENYSGPALIFAEAASDGIIFKVSIQTGGFPGSISWQQVASNPTRVIRDINGTDHRLVQPGPGPWLDLGPKPSTNTDEYPMTDAPNSSDSPNLGANPATRLEASDAFRMWLMYQPNGGHKVPLRAVDWSWWGFAIYGPSGWALGDGSNSVNPEDYPTEIYPSWKSQLTTDSKYYVPPL